MDRQQTNKNNPKKQERVIVKKEQSAKQNQATKEHAKQPEKQSVKQSVKESTNKNQKQLAKESAKEPKKEHVKENAKQIVKEDPKVPVAQQILKKQEQKASQGTFAYLKSLNFDQKKIKKALLKTDDPEKAANLIIQMNEQEKKNGGQSEHSSDYEDYQLHEVDQSDDLKMIFLVRMDLNMGLGKIAAQVAHAALRGYKQMLEQADMDEQSQVYFYAWMESGQKKIVVKVKNQKQLTNAIDQAKKKQINCCFIRDAGLTQIPSGSITVGAIGPAPSALIDPITSKFKLL